MRSDPVWNSQEIDGKNKNSQKEKYIIGMKMID